MGAPDAPDQRGLVEGSQAAEVEDLDLESVLGREPIRGRERLGQRAAVGYQRRALSGASDRGVFQRYGARVVGELALERGEAVVLEDHDLIRIGEGAREHAARTFEGRGGDDPEPGHMGELSIRDYVNAGPRAAARRRLHPQDERDSDLATQTCGGSRRGIHDPSSASRPKLIPS